MENFQCFSGVFKALEEALLLLVLRDMQEEFQDHRAIAGQMSFEVVDVIIALLPERFAAFARRQLLTLVQLGVHLHHQHLFIIRAVEDADPPALGEGLHVAPEKVVIEFFIGRFLEAEDLTPLRIHPGHDMLDGAVLAGGVHRLQNDQHRIDIIGVEELLRLREVRNVLGQDGFCPPFDGVLAQFLQLCRLRPTGVALLQSHLVPRRDLE